MGIMVDSLLWVMQDFVRGPLAGSQIQASGFHAPRISGVQFVDICC